MTQAATLVDMFNDFALDETTEKEGVWVEYRDGVEFKIARKGNKNYRNRITYLWKKHEKVVSGDSEASRKKADELMVDVLARTVLVDWKGPLAVRGELYGEYSVEKAEALLTHTLFKEWVEKQADDNKVYMAVKEDETAKN